MSGTIYGGTYLTGIVLDDPAKQRPVTVTGHVSNRNANAILGTSALAWTVDNEGVIHAIGTAGFGIELTAGGLVDNARGGGAIAPLIEGAGGILVKGAPGTVENSGTIKGTGKNLDGIELAAGGTVVNGFAAATAALVAGGNHGVFIAGAAGSVANFGAITNGGSHADVVLLAGGSVTNGGSASAAARIKSTGTAVYIAHGAGVVTNFGSIEGSGGVFLADGGRVKNGAVGAATAVIAGTSGNAVAIAGARGVVGNFGTIMASGNAAAIALDAGGTIGNGAAGDKTALITSSGSGIYVANGVGIVTNFGIVDASSPSQGTAVSLKKGGTVSNFGKIESASSTGSGVYLSATGLVVNGATASPQAAIDGGNNGVTIRGAAATIENFGSIAGATGSGVYLQLGGSVANSATGLVSGQAAGVAARNGAATITNSGTIAGTGASAVGVGLSAGGVLTNGGRGMKIGLISGITAGVYLKNAGGNVTNYGTIKGKTGFLAAGAGNATLTNFGTVESTAGAAGVAVDMGSGIGHKVLIVEKGAVFVGQIEGGGRGEIKFAGGPDSLAFVSGFATIVLAKGVAHSLSLSDANFKGVDGNAITVFGGNAGNTIDGSALTNAGEAVVIYGGAGTDVLKGGQGSNTFIFSAAALTNRDKITGGGGSDALLLTTAGTIAAGGVSGVQTYRLAGGGANRLSLANTNFAGLSGAITVYCGDRGNLVNGAGLSLASENLVIYGGAGVDRLTGGAGNDIFVFTATALTNTDRIAGSGGKNELLMTTAGKIAAAGVDGVETFVLADGGANSLSLTGANFVGVAGGTITISDGNSGDTVFGATLPAADRIVVYAGTGADKLTGGAGSDNFHAGGDTTMTGKGGTNEFLFSATGHNTITDFAASRTNKIVFSNSGFDLKLSGAGSTPKLLPAGLFVANATGAFTNPNQRFAYDTENGKLFYSATGTTKNEELVVTLTGHPVLTAPHLFYGS